MIKKKQSGIGSGKIDFLLMKNSILVIWYSVNKDVFVMIAIARQSNQVRYFILPIMAPVSNHHFLW